MKVKYKEGQTIITLMHKTDKIFINTPYCVNTVNQDSLNRVYINISEK